MYNRGGRCFENGRNGRIEYLSTGAIMTDLEAYETDLHNIH